MHSLCRSEPCTSGLRKFILSPCLKGNAREFPDGGGKVDAGPCPDNRLGGE